MIRGLIRNTDNLGRVVIPKEIRDILGISKNTPLEIFLDDDNVIIRRYEQSCAFCGKMKKDCNLRICDECLEKLNKIKDL